MGKYGLMLIVPVGSNQGNTLVNQVKYTIKGIEEWPTCMIANPVIQMGIRVYKIAMCESLKFKSRSTVTMAS